MDSCDSLGGEERQQILAQPSKGVLLYYKYIDLGEAGRAEVQSWYERDCGLQGLRGRWGALVYCIFFYFRLLRVPDR